MRLTVNGDLLDTDAETLLDLVGHLPPGQAVAVNHELVPRAEHAARVLADDDRVDVVTAVAGG